MGLSSRLMSQPTPLDEGLVAAHCDGCVILREPKVAWGYPVDRIVVGTTGIYVIDQGIGSKAEADLGELARAVGEAIADSGLLLPRFSVQPVLWWVSPPAAAVLASGVPLVEPRDLSRYILRQPQEMDDSDVTAVSKALLQRFRAAA